ncbi:MAG TPA: tRNA lysidine(34) synthetase TilS [Chitinophagaceae bacterium]|nr:tRNA lysidine(34) synthetase TilS [Chitinophagaceae bacterium]
MNLLQRYQQFIKKENLFSPKDKLILAVSGGVDSVVLCELCKQAGYDFIIAHCNFQLRGEESERDEKFVRSLGEKYKVEVKVKGFEAEKYSRENKISIQEAARVLRYEWFEELARSEMSNVKNRSQPSVTHFSLFTFHVLTAHHADDNLETLLMNFFRGTGLHGLTGIPVTGPSEVLNYVRRPLLPFSKAELVDFAKENKLEYVEDSSNVSSKYTRNFFRNEIIPVITRVYPEAKANLLDNIDRFKQIERLYKVAVGDIKKKLVKEKGKELHIPVKQLMGYDNRALIYEIIKDFGFTEKQIDEVIKLSESESGKYIDSPGSDYRIIKHRHWFIISSVNPGESATIIIEQHHKQIIFQEGILMIETLTSIPKAIGIKPQTPNETACLDAKEIAYPLILRKWKQGDYFYPLGMKKKKKLSRFFIDQKLSRTAKERVWVIEMNKKIIWVVGKRIDERFKVTEKTRSILKLGYEPRV